MTISIGIRVNDGLVIASDSALTLSGADGVRNVYMNGNKILNIHKGLPMGVAFWGLASIGGHSVAFWLKELRSELEGGVTGKQDFRVDSNNYQVFEIAKHVQNFFNNLVRVQLAENPETQLPGIGLLVAGYSSGSLNPESYVVQLIENRFESPYDPINGATGWFSHGQPELISRILNGYSMDLSQALINLKVDPKDIPSYVQAIVAQTQIPLVQADMPIQDAIDLAAFLADSTIKFVKFAPGANTVDGPIEIATITRHEGFKWIHRKHYYPLELNGGHHE